MKHKLFLIISLVSFTICSSQSELAKSGTITLADNQKIAFNNVRLQDGKFVFFDIKSGTENSLAISQIKYIEDSADSKVFTNKTVVDRTREADMKAEVEAKRLAVEEATKKDIAWRKALEELKTAKAFGLYPNGVYATKEDFLNKKPSNQEELVAKEVAGQDRYTYEGIPDECYFYYLESDKKVKNSFAVSFKGQLYFQIDAILNNRNKVDGSQSNDYPKSFVKVLINGENYYYTEAALANYWAQVFTVAAAGPIAGYALANNMVKVKGIVWDIKNQEFNIFRSCQDYNDFIRDKYPEGIQECKGQAFDIIEVRKAIARIK